MVKIKKIDIEKSLLEQLRAKKADVSVFTDLVNDYLGMWEVKNKILSDISECGATIDGIKANPIVKELRDTNKQMLALLKQLGIDADKMVEVTEDDEL